MTLGEARDKMRDVVVEIQRSGLEVRTWQGTIVISTPIAQDGYSQTEVDPEDVGYKPSARHTKPDARHTHTTGEGMGT